MPNRKLIIKNLAYTIILIGLFVRKIILLRIENKIYQELEIFYKNAHNELESILRKDATLIISNKDHVYLAFKHKIDLKNNELLFVKKGFYKFKYEKIRTESEVSKYVKSNKGIYFTFGPYTSNLEIKIEDNFAIDNIFVYIENKYFKNMCSNLISEIDKKFWYLAGFAEIQLEKFDLYFRYNGYTSTYKIDFDEIGTYRTTSFSIGKIDDEFKEFYFKMKELFDNSFYITNKRVWTAEYVMSVVKYLYEKNFIYTLDFESNPSVIIELFPFKFVKSFFESDFRKNEAVNGGICLSLTSNLDPKIYNYEKFKRLQKYANGIFFTHFV